MNAVKTAASQTEGMGGDARDLRHLKWSHMPGYGELSMDQLREAVSKAIFADRHHMGGFDPAYSKGHQSVEDINYNSLNRIVTAFVRAALTPPETAEAVPVADEPDTSAADREALELQWGKQTPEGVWVASPQHSVLVRCCAHFEGEIVPVHVKETVDGITIEPVASSEAARLREDLERVTRELEEETALRVGAIDRMKDAERDRDDAAKALKSVTEELGLFRDFVINNATVWTLGSNHHHPIWARVAGRLEGYTSPRDGEKWTLVRALTPPETAEAVPDACHADDLAVDSFSVAMKAKLADARAKGKGGWYDETECSRQYLSDELRRHALKPDPLDVANFAMFLHQRGEAIAPAIDDRERLVEALREAAVPFVRHYADWMNRWPDDQEVSVFPRHTYGEIRALRAALATEASR